MIGAGLGILIIMTVGIVLVAVAGFLWLIAQTIRHEDQKEL